MSVWPKGQGVVKLSAATTQERFSHPARVPDEKRTLRLELLEDQSTVFAVLNASPCLYVGVVTCKWKLLFASEVVAAASIFEHWWADDTRNFNISHF